MGPLFYLSLLSLLLVSISFRPIRLHSLSRPTATGRQQPLVLCAPRRGLYTPVTPQNDSLYGEDTRSCYSPLTPSLLPGGQGSIYLEKETG